MDKESLIAMGLTDEQATKIMQDINNNYAPKTQFNQINTELQTAKNTIKERDKQLETLQKSTGDINALEKQITDLQTENKNQQTKHDEQIKAFKLENAIEKELISAKAINPATVKPLLSSFLEKATLSEDGTVLGLKEQIENLVKDQNTSFLFKTDALISGTSPASIPTTVPDSKQAGYETRLADARKQGNQALVVAIKREASEQGIELY